MGFTYAKSGRYLALSRGVFRCVVMIEFERNIIFLIPRFIETPDLLGSFITKETKSSQLCLTPGSRAPPPTSSWIPKQ